MIILAIIFTFAFSAYSTSEVAGSPGKIWELLNDAAKRHPVSGNKDGSYLTMQSHEGAIFFVINIVGNFGTVFLDNGYYNKAIAASPVDALPGYVMGGLSWFAIPWLCATTMGLAALALENNPVFPTYPNRMSHADVSAGLVLPYAAVALLGKGGAGATLLLIFMAVTSASSAELIAVSSIWTYDIYQTYINPKASGKFLIRMSHACCIVYAICLASFSTGLFYAGVSMGYLYLLMVSLSTLNFDTMLTHCLGLHHLQRCHPSNPGPHVERPKLASRSRRPGPRLHMRPHRLARDSQAPVRRSQRRLHWLQQPHAGGQRDRSAQSPHFRPNPHVHIRQAELQLGVDAYDS